MTFLHKETKWQKIDLIQSWNKSSYWVVWEAFFWHLKPLSLEDTTFNATWISWELSKFTIKSNIDIKQADQVEIDSKKYVVKEVKHYSWISFQTTKILLAIQ